MEKSGKIVINREENKINTKIMIDLCSSTDRGNRSCKNDESDKALNSVDLVRVALFYLLFALDVIL